MLISSVRGQAGQPATQGGVLMQQLKRGHEELLHRRGNYLVRRLRLSPGEATAWHRDPFQRISVVVSGDQLAIEFRDGRQPQPWTSPPAK